MLTNSTTPTRFATLATECVESSTLSVSALKRRHYRSSRMAHQLVTRTFFTPVCEDRKLFKLSHLVDEVSWFYLYRSLTAPQSYDFSTKSTHFFSKNSK